MTATAAILLLSTGMVRGADVSWNVSGPAPWNEDANWDPDIVPDANFADVAVFENGGTSVVGVGVSAAGLRLNDGTVDIQPGGVLTIDESVTLGRNGTLRISGDGKLETTGMTGSGQLDLVGKDVSVSVAEDFSGGTLKFGIGSDGNALVNVGGDAKLGGTIVPDFASDVVPAFGDSWQFLKANEITGQPDVALPEGASLPLGLSLEVTTAGGDASISVTNRPVLSVSRSTGRAEIKNVVGDALTMTSYSIGSSSGLLAPGDWSSLNSQQVEGWTPANPREQRLAELNLSGELSIEPGASLDLGNAYNAARGANPREEDVTFEFSTPDGAVLDGLVEFTGPANDLVLRVDPETGNAELQNQSEFIDPFDITFYSILSQSGALSVEGWNSLEDSSAAGEGWAEANPQDVALAELNLTDSHVFGNGTVIPLGTIFGPGGAQDLVLEFGTVAGELLVGTVEYGPLGPDGDWDCNADGVIDVNDANCTPAAGLDGFLSDHGLIKGDADGDGEVQFSDFVILSTNFGNAGQYTDGDFDKDGTVQFGDFVILADNFGQAASATAAVPEPSGVALIGLAGMGLVHVVRRRISRDRRKKMNPSTLSRPLGCAVLALLCLAQAASGQTETQSFDSEQATADAGWTFNDEAQNANRDCPDCVTDLGWKDSNNAGGTAGEAGGSLHRSGGLPIGFYGDLSIGSLSLNTKIEASGKVILINNDFDGSAHFGFFDGVRLANDPADFGAELGITINEPGGGVDPNFRWGTQVRTNDIDIAQGGGGFVNGLPDNEPLEFSISYDPAEGDFGVLSVSIGDDEPAELVLTQATRESVASFTAFGIYTGPFLSSADPRNMELLIDDITYSSLGTALTPGDFNSDGAINLEDFAILQANFNTKGKEFADGDMDFNGRVTGADFLAFREIFNAPAQSGGAAAVPEPGSCLLALLGLVCLAVARRRGAN